MKRFLIVLLIIISSCVNNREDILLTPSKPFVERVFPPDFKNSLGKTPFDVVMFDDDIIGVNHELVLFKIKHSSFTYSKGHSLPIKRNSSRFVFQSNTEAILETYDDEGNSAFKEVEFYKVADQENATLLFRFTTPDKYAGCSWLNSKNAVIAVDSAENAVFYQLDVVGNSVKRLGIKKDFTTLDLHFKDLENGWILGSAKSTSKIQYVQKTVDKCKSWSETELPIYHNTMFFSKLSFSKGKLYANEIIATDNSLANVGGRIHDYAVSKDGANSFEQVKLFYSRYVASLSFGNDKIYALGVNRYIDHNVDNELLKYNYAYVLQGDEQGNNWSRVFDETIPGTEIKLSSNGRYILIIHKSPGHNASNSLFTFDTDNNILSRIIYPFNYLN